MPSKAFVDNHTPHIFDGLLEKVRFASQDIDIVAYCLNHEPAQHASLPEHPKGAARIVSAG